MTDVDVADAKKRDRRRTAAFVAVIAVATLVTLVQGYSLNAVRNLAEQNRALLQEDADQRAANRDRFAQSDRALCLAVEKLNAAQRLRAIESYRDLARTLRILHVDATPEIRRAARDNKAKLLDRFKARKGGCASLPSTGVKSGPAETDPRPPVVTTEGATP